MKFIVSSTDLLSHLEAVSRVQKSKKKLPTLKELFSFTFKEEKAITSEQVVIKVKIDTKGSIKELLRRLSIYLGKKVSTQLLQLRNFIYNNIAIFFGLCCSSPSYIFNAIFGANASRALSLS